MVNVNSFRIGLSQILLFCLTFLSLLEGTYALNWKNIFKNPNLNPANIASIIAQLNAGKGTYQTNIYSTTQSATNCNTQSGVIVKKVGPKAYQSLTTLNPVPTAWDYSTGPVSAYATTITLFTTTTAPTSTITSTTTLGPTSTVTKVITSVIVSRYNKVANTKTLFLTSTEVDATISTLPITYTSTEVDAFTSIHVGTVVYTVNVTAPNAYYTSVLTLTETDTENDYFTSTIGSLEVDTITTTTTVTETQTTTSTADTVTLTVAPQKLKAKRGIAPYATSAQCHVSYWQTYSTFLTTTQVASVVVPSTTITVTQTLDIPTLTTTLILTTTKTYLSVSTSIVSTATTTLTTSVSTIASTTVTTTSFSTDLTTNSPTWYTSTFTNTVTVPVTLNITTWTTVLATTSVPITATEDDYYEVTTTTTETATVVVTPTATVTAALQPQPQTYSFNGQMNGNVLQLSFTIDLSQTQNCDAGGYVITDISGNYGGNGITYQPNYSYHSGDNCLYPNNGNSFFDSRGIIFRWGIYDVANLYSADYNGIFQVWHRYKYGWSLLKLFKEESFTGQGYLYQ